MRPILPARLSLLLAACWTGKPLQAISTRA
jgi:hypothetical protein